jgi:hypothetical protein
VNPIEHDGKTDAPPDLTLRAVRLIPSGVSVIFCNSLPTTFVVGYVVSSLAGLADFYGIANCKVFFSAEIESIVLSECESL